ncbi:hypothetical protein BLA29_009077, partial [Euroglyphus maynei]
MTHWHSPRFHAYFPTANSYPAICGDMLSTALACIGFTWNAAPSCTELEMRMMDWFAQMLGLPETFHFKHGPGGGIIQTTASESTLIAILGARTKILQQYGLDNRIVDNNDDDDDDYYSDSDSKRYDLLGRMVAYTSNQSHSSVEKAAMLSATRIRLIPVNDSDLSMNVDILQQRIVADLQRGLIPTIVIATLGTTNTCAFDDLYRIGQLCSEYQIWLHVDAAYAGSSFICPEFRHYMNGIEVRV